MDVWGVSGSIPKDTCHCLWAKATLASWAGLGYGGGEEWRQPPATWERQQSDQGKQRQVDADELGTIPNLRGG